MDLTLVFAAVTGLDRMREQFDDATPRQQHTRRRPATQGHPRRRLWRRGLRTATDGAPTDADRRTRRGFVANGRLAVVIDPFTERSSGQCLA